MKRLIQAVLLVVMGISCGKQAPPSNVMIIAVDTLRPDHLGCYGYHADTSPNIDALAGEGILFENVISQAPWTHPSFGTVFTSLYPSQHGATTVATRMGTSFPTLAGLLSDNAYATCAIVNAPTFSPRMRMDRGFQEYDFIDPWKERRADEITDAALEWIEGHTGEQFFIFVHYFDPHLDYSPPAPYDTLFNPAYEGPMRHTFHIDSLSRWAPPEDGGIETLSGQQRKQIESLYDGEIAFADREIGRLLAGLRASGLHRKTLVLFLSDHGEEFLDHGALDHGHSLYDELLRVPLIVSLPGTIRKGVRKADYVRLLDITPTILDFLGIESAPGFEGSSLKPLIVGSGTVRHYEHQLLQPPICYSEALRQSNTTKAITVYPWKLIHDTQTDKAMLFNLKDDSVEKQNLLAVEEEQQATLEQMLFKTVFAVSDTWFIELGSDATRHTFSLELSTESSFWPSHITAARLLEAGENLTPLRGTVEMDASSRSLRIVDLPVEDRVVLAFKLEIPYSPIRFNLSIDGTRTTERIFMGRSMMRPETMPFTITVQRSDSASVAEPDQRPPPPYFLIWNRMGRYQAEVAVKLDEETKKQLRALGYIQ
jgi:arylsulfatase A-like enzyme